MKNRLKKDKNAKVIYKKYLKKIKHVDKVIGKAGKNISLLQNKDGISQVGIWVTRTIAKQTGSQIAVLNSGALRSSIEKATLLFPLCTV